MRKSYVHSLITLLALASLTLLALSSSTTSLAQECHKTFRFKGTGNDRQPKDYPLKFKRPLIEPPSFRSADQETTDQTRYGQFYQIVGAPTFKQNCAGHVMDRLWGTGNTYFPADQFYTDIIKTFGTEVTRQPQPNDIVVFFSGGLAKHVALVVEPSNSIDLVEIESKDNEQSIIKGLLDRSRKADPIMASNGDFKIFRINRSAVSVTEESSGVCDVTPLTVTIDVNESLKGNLRDLANANITIKDLNGGMVASGQSGADGKAVFPLSPDKITAARGGLSVKVTLKGFEDKPDTIPGSMLQGSEGLWNVTMKRTADNPADADPNLPPGFGGMTLAEWEKKFSEIAARVAAAEVKKAEFIKKAGTSQSSTAKVDQAEAKAREQLAELKKLKPAVDRVEQYCKEASKANQKLEELEKSIREKEKAATKLTDELLKQTDACASREDVAKIREGTTRLSKLIDDLADPVKEARKQNDELKRLQIESLKELAELKKAPGFRKGVADQEEEAGKAFRTAMEDYAKLAPLESEINSARFALSGELAKLRSNYPANPIPQAVEDRITALDGRINSLMQGISTGPPPTGIAAKLLTMAALTTEANTLISQYQAAVCTITTREDLLDKMVGSVTFAGLGLQTILNSEPQIKQCEAKLDCAAQIKKIEEALDIGDLEAATKIIAQIKGASCDTRAVEARWQQISDRISFDLATARNRWRDIGSTCYYRAAYEAALVIQKQYPKHPWIVQNFDAIQRGYKAEEQIRSLVTDKLVPANRDRNYDEAEMILAQIDQIAASYPCMVAEAKKLRTEYGRGKPSDKETERACQELLTQIQAAIAGKRLVEAAQKLAEAKQKCSNVSPALFTALGEAQKQLDQAIQQAINDIPVNVGKCEYEVAYDLAQQIQKLKPSALTAAELQKLREQADAQKNARQFLLPGMEAIKQKDIKGAINSLRQAQGVLNLPQCMRDNIGKLLKELELRKSFMDLTELVQQATAKCDYKEAARVIAEIKRITPREQYIIDWLTTNEQILAELQNRERRALEFIRQADAIAGQADTASTTEPVDFNRVSALGLQAMNLLTQADQEAPKCMPRQQMEQIRQRLLALAQRKKPEIAASIVLLIDTSGSMRDNNKMMQAKDAARRAARQVSKTTEIAILNFDGGCGGGAMQIAAAFTTDVNVLIAAIDRLQPGGGTPMYVSTAEAVVYAQKNGRGKSRNLILMSDGGDSCRDEQAKAAAAIRSSNIPVSTIGFDVGSNQQAQGDLSNLATMTNGRTFSASAADPREIIRAFNLAMLPSLLKDLDFGAGGAASGYFSQAKSMVQQQNISGALMMLQQANQLAPNSPNLNFNLSLLYESEDQLIPAMNHANNYLKLAPGAVDRDDVENRIREIQQELKLNPRVVMDSSGCRDTLVWAQAERDIAKRAKDAGRLQAILEISILSQRGECEKARSLAAGYKERYR